MTAAAALVACSPQAPAQNVPANAPVDQGEQTGLEKVPLTIRSATGEHRFTVEVAATPEQQARGLMFRRSLGPDQGMIFPYSPPQEVGFWMKNTLIPLDMIFIRGDGTIVRIATAQPHSLQPVSSGEPISAVLEIAGGRAVQLGIKEGDIATWTR